LELIVRHREELAGVTGSNRNYFVDCSVHFTEEERGVIKARGLYDQYITVRASTPLPSGLSFHSTNVMRVIGLFMIIGGFFYGIIVEGIAGVRSNFGGPIFFIGVALAIYGWVRTRQEDKRFENSEQTITVQQLLARPTFTIHAFTPAHANAIEQEIRDDLTLLKSTIRNSVQLNPSRTYRI
jgi:hypothetical protein